jgi:hypothetical protein
MLAGIYTCMGEYRGRSGIAVLYGVECETTRFDSIRPPSSEVDNPNRAPRILDGCKMTTACVPCDAIGSRPVLNSGIASRGCQEVPAALDRRSHHATHKLRSYNDRKGPSYEPATFRLAAWTRTTAGAQVSSLGLEILNCLLSLMPRRWAEAEFSMPKREWARRMLDWVRALHVTHPSRIQGALQIMRDKALVAESHVELQQRAMSSATTHA